MFIYRSFCEIECSCSGIDDSSGLPPYYQ